MRFNGDVTLRRDHILIKCCYAGDFYRRCFGQESARENDAMGASSPCIVGRPFAGFALGTQTYPRWCYTPFTKLRERLTRR
jgi:hypothetical protein